MKTITSLSITAILTIMSASAYATAQDAFQSRFSLLYQLSKSSQYTFDVFKENPWCGYKGSPIPPGAPGAAYPDYKTGTTLTNTMPTAAELNWLKGLKAATDQKAYVDANLATISYEHMGNSLNEANQHCAARVFSNEKNDVGIKVIMQQKYTVSVLGSASSDCKAFPGYEAQLKKDVADLKHDADEFKKKTCPKCFPVEGNKLKDREKDLKKKQQTAGLMFQNCVTNYSQLFVNPVSLYNKP